MTKRIISFKGLNILHNGFECYGRCRFCIIKRERVNQVALARAIAQADRFHAWKRQRRPADYRVFISYGRGFNYSLQDAVAIVELAKRLGEDASEITMGGMAFMDDAPLRQWLQERYDIGMNQIRLSLAGTEALHDKWIGRPGDFAFHLRAARLAAEIGFRRNEWLFVSNSTIPYLPALVDELDKIPGGTCRGFRIMNWERYPRRALEERLTRETYNQLPDFVRNNIQFAHEMQSEREWVAELNHWPPEPQEEPWYLNLRLHKKMIDQLESLSCEEVIADLERRSREIYEAIPPMKTLGEWYGDPHNLQMYHRGEIQRKWIEHYIMDQTTFKPERGLTWIY